MPRPSIELEGAAIVLVGAFNPGIFHPSWLVAQDLLRKEEAEQATAGAEQFIITREVTAFKAGWLEIQVTSERFSAQTADPAHYVALRDLVVGTFRILEHTRFSEMGMNRLLHFRMPTEADYVDFGHFLAPKTAWSELMDKPGLLSLRISGQKPTSSAIYNVTVEPSLRIRGGVFFQSNEHYKIEGDDSATGLLAILDKNWTDAQSYSEHVASQLFEEFYKGKQ